MIIEQLDRNGKSRSSSVLFSLTSVKAPFSLGAVEEIGRICR